MDSIDKALDADWWRDQTILAAQLRDLVEGFDSIASFAVPYARLPRRLGAYAEEFPRWADFASQTPQALLLRPKLGGSAVRALIETAAEAVRVHRETVAAGKAGAAAAVARLVGQLDDFDREILAAQDWTLDPVPQRVIAERLGVHPVSVSRNLPRARARFAEMLADPAHQEVVEHASELRRRLGPYLPAEAAALDLRRLGVDPSSQAGQVLLHIAGPYARRDDWLESTATAAGGRARALAAVGAVFDGQGAPKTDTLLDALTSLGISTGIALAFLECQVALRRFSDNWVPWAGDTTANMTEAALHVLGVPATAETIFATIGGSRISVERVNAVLSKDSRFARASRSTWGLSAWALPEYVGIAHAIGERIDARGGRATSIEVMSDLRAQFPDITESSIRSYMSTLEFITTRGMIRRRTKADGWPPVPPLNTIRGVLRNGPNEIRIAIPVTSELLRGSGQTVHPAVATAVGVAPGEQRTFVSPHGAVTLYWKLASTTGANLGSLRAQAAGVEAATGDTLVLGLRVDDTSLEVTRLGSEEQAAVRLHKLLGRAIRNPVAALAAALDCRREDVGAVLAARGDHNLASLLDIS
ncbi:Uncharacterised protein [Mycolicibacterium vanbaalenii]|uniref:Uncharacterized protein n=1 Tax=Mycolicibacterium vanbaalenii TaxID=110539 RepID=A0A5S9R433_MYCVN|nr:hypothetical protein [Mycolicibacterium vanbaalenii]CAA0127295.1 Uncharacterised protein [Mycolicibacterium vanbaalenii]